MNVIEELLLAFLVISGGLAARAGTIEIKGSPFEVPPIVVPEFAQRDFLITDYGASPDGTKCTESFAAAMAQCEQAGGGRVVVPKGTWLTGAIRFRSNCNLHLCEGAVVEFTDEPEDYLPVVPTSWEGVECLNYSPLVYAYGVENVAITGKGELRPRMRTWRKWFGQGPAHRFATERLYYWCSTNAPLAARDLTKIPESNVRPHLLQFNRSKNILLDGFSIRESPFWTVHLYQSENVVVRNVTTDCRGRNSDGVDVEMTRNVLIENCDFCQGDDGVVLKSGRNQDAWRFDRPTENVIIRNCNIRFAHTLLGIGSELSGGIRNVWMKDCRIDRCYNLLYAKTNRRRGGFIRNILVEDIVCSGGLQGAIVGVDMDVLYQWARFPDFERRYTEIDGLTLRNTSVRSCDWAIRIAGDGRLPPKNIRVDGLKVGFCREGEREIVNCDGVEIDGLEQTDPVGAANDRKRIFTACSVEDAVGPSEVIVRQLSNARSDVSELLDLSLWCTAEGKFDFRAFPGRYRLRWLAKDGDYREKEISIPDDISSSFRPIPSKFLRRIEMARKRYQDWKGTDEAVVFPVLSDVHSWFDEWNPDDWSDPKTHLRIVQEAVREFDADFVADLGDIGIDSCRDWRTASTPDRARRQLAAYFGQISGMNVPYLFCIGNHDHGRPDWGEGWIGNAELGTLFNGWSSCRFAGFSLSGGQDYGWYDVPGKALRIIFVNTSEEKRLGVSAAQLLFLERALDTVPKQSSVLVLSHVPFHPDVTAGRPDDQPRDYKWANAFRICLEDFSARGGRLAGVVSGHQHFDASVYDRGVRHVVVKGLGHYGYKPPFREGVVCQDIDDYSLETNFDVVVVKPEKREVRMFRIGSGDKTNDREWRY